MDILLVAVVIVVLAINFIAGSLVALAVGKVLAKLERRKTRKLKG